MTTVKNDWYDTTPGLVQNYFEQRRRQIRSQLLLEGMKRLSPEAFEKAIFKAKLGGDNFDEDYLRSLYHRAKKESGNDDETRKKKDRDD